jgi:hypothetical protein
VSPRQHALASLLADTAEVVLDTNGRDLAPLRKALVLWWVEELVARLPEPEVAEQPNAS